MPLNVPNYITTIIALPLLKVQANSTEFLPRTALLFVVDNHTERGLKLWILWLRKCLDSPSSRVLYSKSQLRCLAYLVFISNVFFLPPRAPLLKNFPQTHLSPSGRLLPHTGISTLKSPSPSRQLLSHISTLKSLSPSRQLLSHFSTPNFLLPSRQLQPQYITILTLCLLPDPHLSRSKHVEEMLVAGELS
jgi:hypothetical protein